MTLSMYQASVPVFLRALSNLSHVLKKGAEHAATKKVADEVILQTRLIPDMLPLARQVQIATDMAKNATARLAGVDPLKFEDNETTFAQLHDRIERAVEYIKSFKPEQIDGSETRKIVLPTRSGEQHFEGDAYLLHFVLPNVFFHCTTAYAILRVSGAEIGKNDFIGKA
ncbi:MAG TPA: DUF1993 domain-containing protein [Dyella sp.]|uniref:DUF1993 domain-containing protein n=1 Tax=Dyella sp. TaxID=1869338 RepID=UPI002F94124A